MHGSSEKTTLRYEILRGRALASIQKFGCTWCPCVSLRLPASFHRPVSCSTGQMVTKLPIRVIVSVMGGFIYVSPRLSHVSIVMNCVVSSQQKQILCHVPLPLHEWSIAPRPHFQLVQVWGRFACKFLLHTPISVGWGINFNDWWLLVSAVKPCLVVCCWLPVPKRKEMPFPIWSALHRNANQS